MHQGSGLNPAAAPPAREHLKQPEVQREDDPHHSQPANQQGWLLRRQPFRNQKQSESAKKLRECERPFCWAWTGDWMHCRTQKPRRVHPRPGQEVGSGSPGRVAGTAMRHPRQRLAACVDGKRDPPHHHPEGHFVEETCCRDAGQGLADEIGHAPPTGIPSPASPSLTQNSHSKCRFSDGSTRHPCPRTVGSGYEFAAAIVAGINSRQCTGWASSQLSPTFASTTIGTSRFSAVDISVRASSIRLVTASAGASKTSSS